MSGLDKLNELPVGDLVAELRAVCTSPAWVRAVVAGRPYATPEDLYTTSDRAVMALDGTEFEAALAGHPRIGERADAQSSAEQRGMADAGADLAEQIRAGNVEYEARFGHVYLVCATGLSAEELLARLRDRLGNEPAAERPVALGELAKINRLRLARLL